MLKRILIILIIVGVSFFTGYEFSVYINQSHLASNNSKISKPIEKRPAQSEEKFSKEELKDFKLIKRFYEGFDYSDKYTLTSEDEKRMIFKEENNLILGSYISYHVVYAFGRIVNYAFDAGTAYRGYGSYYIIDDNTVVKIEKTFGVTNNSYEISKNGVKIDSGTEESDFYKDKLTSSTN